MKIVDTWQNLLAQVKNDGENRHTTGDMGIDEYEDELRINNFEAAQKLLERLLAAAPQ